MSGYSITNDLIIKKNGLVVHDMSLFIRELRVQAILKSRQCFYMQHLNLVSSISRSGPCRSPLLWLIMKLFLTSFTLYHCCLSMYRCTSPLLAKMKASGTGKLLDNLPREGVVDEMCSGEFNMSISAMIDVKGKLPTQSIYYYTITPQQVLLLMNHLPLC